MLKARPSLEHNSFCFRNDPMRKVGPIISVLQMRLRKLKELDEGHIMRKERKREDL